MGLFTSPMYPNIRLTQRNKRHKIFLYEKGEKMKAVLYVMLVWLGLGVVISFTNV